ncbi:hypothetical protein KIN20_002683, partial [Parelaphostrongylus tenuis]
MDEKNSGVVFEENISAFLEDHPKSWADMFVTCSPVDSWSGCLVAVDLMQCLDIDIE